MTNKALNAIRQAEEQAEMLCRVAEEKATEMRARIAREGAAHCAAVKKQTETEYAAQIEEVKLRTERLVAKHEKDALAEAQALSKLAEPHLDEAVEQIIWGILKKCQ